MTQPIYYAGIGSRVTPQSILLFMTEIADGLNPFNARLRSGHADGADAAFENGAEDLEVYLPWDGYNGGRLGKLPFYQLHHSCEEEAKDLVLRLHPAPHHLSDSVIKLHMRNVPIILGHKLDRPVDFVICWTPGGKLQGGTAMALRIAIENQIPIINLGAQGREESIELIRAQLQKFDAHEAA